MVIVGGLGTVEGPVIGAFVIYYLVDRSLEGQPVLQALLSGVLVIVVIVLAPKGISGLLRTGVAALAGARSRRRAPSVPSPLQLVGPEGEPVRD
jgi:branched-chain amino acid transport system permease protein